MGRCLGFCIAFVAATVSHGAEPDIERLRQRLMCLPQDQREEVFARFKSTIYEPTLAKAKQWALEVKAEREQAVKAANDCIAAARRQTNTPREVCATEIAIAKQYDNGTATIMTKEAIEKWFARELPGMRERVEAMFDEAPPC
jgi:hypothetical protein